MKINYKELEIDIDSKYYSIIELYPDDLIENEIYLDFDNDVIAKITAYYNEYHEIIILIILESNDLNKLNNELNSSVWKEEDILLNRQLINEEL